MATSCVILRYGKLKKDKNQEDKSAQNGWKKVVPFSATFFSVKKIKYSYSKFCGIGTVIDTDTCDRNSRWHLNYG